MEDVFKSAMEGDLGRAHGGGLTLHVDWGPYDQA
jgi:hypothetical protein